MSLEDGAKIQGALITEKLRSVDVNTSQLRSDIATLVERREKFNNNIDQVTKEVRKVDHSYLNMIRRHETSVTENLARKKSL